MGNSQNHHSEDDDGFFLTLGGSSPDRPRHCKAAEIEAVTQLFETELPDTSSSAQRKDVRQAVLKQL